MTRFQKLIVVILALILISIMALVLVVAFKPTAPELSSSEQTSTWVFAFATSHADQVNAIATNTYGTLQSP